MKKTPQKVLELQGKGTSVTCVTLQVRSQEEGAWVVPRFGRGWSAPPLTIGRRRSSRSPAQSTFGQNQVRSTKKYLSHGSGSGSGTRGENQMQINNQLQAGLQQQPQVDTTALGTTTADEIARAMRSQSQPRTVVDIKGIGKPAPFKGDEVKFRMFAHKLAGFMSAVWPHARIVLRWAADQLETQRRRSGTRMDTHRSHRVVSGRERVQCTAACSPHRAR